jgi:hypothetical protein
VARLIQLPQLGFALDAVGFEVADARLQGVALDRELAHAPVVIADLLGAGKQVAARLARQLLSRADARLQGLEPRALVGALVLAGSLASSRVRASRARSVFSSAKFASTWRSRLCVAFRLASVSACLRDSRAASALALSSRSC